MINVITALFISNSQAFWADAKAAAEKAADAEIITDAVTEFTEAVTDEQDVSKHFDSVKKTNFELRSTLSDLNYTHDEIDDILSNNNNSIGDISSALSNASRRIKRARDLKKKLSLLTAGSPAAFTATQSLEMNETLRDIHKELMHQRIDRELEKQKQQSAILEQKKADKKKEAFFKEQFALMAKSSRTNKVSFYPFKTDSKEAKEVQSTKSGLLGIW